MRTIPGQMMLVTVDADIASSEPYPERTLHRLRRRTQSWRNALDRAESVGEQQAWANEQDAYESYKNLCESLLCCLEADCERRSLTDYCDVHQLKDKEMSVVE